MKTLPKYGLVQISSKLFKKFGLPKNIPGRLLESENQIKIIQQNWGCHTPQRIMDFSSPQNVKNLPPDLLYFRTLWENRGVDNPSATVNGFGLGNFTFIIPKKYIKRVSYRPIFRNVENIKPFQIEGINRLVTKQGNIILGDEMGLGKTIQALLWLSLMPKQTPAYIICPAGAAKYHWQNEILEKTFIPPEIVYVIDGLCRPENVCLDELQAKSDQIKIIIINYEITFSWKEKLESLVPPKSLILDECQYITNRKTKRTQAIFHMAKNATTILPISGTVMNSKPKDLWNALFLVAPNLFPSKTFFLKRYCNARMIQGRWFDNGARNLRELNQLIKPYIIRRTKMDVMDEYTDPVRSVLYFDMEKKYMKEYQNAVNNFLFWVQENRGVGAVLKYRKAITLTKMEVMKQLAVKGKLKQVIKWMDNALLDGKKLVVFTSHREILKQIYGHYSPQKIVKMEGGMTNKQKWEAKEKFQNDEKIKVLVGNIISAGTNITLTAAQRAIVVEFPRNPMLLRQAEDRINRIGQTGCVTIYYPLALNTIETVLFKRIEKTGRELHTILDGAKDKHIFFEDIILSDIISSLKGGK